MRNPLPSTITSVPDLIEIDGHQADRPAEAGMAIYLAAGMATRQTGRLKDAGDRSLPGGQVDETRCTNGMAIYLATGMAIYLATGMASWMAAGMATRNAERGGRGGMRGWP